MIFSNILEVFTISKTIANFFHLIISMMNLRTDSFEHTKIIYYKVLKKKQVLKLA